LLALDDFQRAQITYIIVSPIPGGFGVRMSQYGMYVTGADSSELPSGVSVEMLSAPDDITAIIDWQTPAWDQILEVVHDPWLTQPEQLGTTSAAEGTYSANHGSCSEREMVWHMTTHGRARSAERLHWIKTRQPNPTL
jgi:hypothetical protein